MLWKIIIHYPLVILGAALSIVGAIALLQKSANTKDKLLYLGTTALGLSMFSIATNFVTIGGIFGIFCLVSMVIYKLPSR